MYFGYDIVFDPNFGIVKQSLLDIGLLYRRNYLILIEVNICLAFGQRFYKLFSECLDVVHVFSEEVVDRDLTGKFIFAVDKVVDSFGLV